MSDHTPTPRTDAAKFVVYVTDSTMRTTEVSVVHSTAHATLERELAALREQLEVAEKDVLAKSIIIGTWSNQCESERAERIAAEARLAEAQKDAARLDWFENSTDPTRKVYPWPGGFTAVSDNHCYDQTTVRAAIDAAMKGAE